MKKTKKFKVAALILCAMSVFTVVLAEPGASDDPLISKSYIDTVLMPQIKQYVEEKISGLGKTQNPNTQTAESFKVLELAAGQKLMCEAGAELILRMGKAEIIATEKGGLADTTAGFDLANGTDMPANHLLIVPVSDGRGITAKNNVIVMIKGSYEIK